MGRRRRAQAAADLQVERAGDTLCQVKGTAMAQVGTKSGDLAATVAYGREVMEVFREVLREV